MTWTALLLIGVAVADLAHSVRPAPVLDELLGAAVVVWLGLLAGQTRPVDLVALAVVAVIVLLWGRTVTRAFSRRVEVRSRETAAWVPLVVLGLGVVLVLACSGLARPADGLIGAWLRHVDLPVLRALGATGALLVLAAFLVQLSTGNVVVRLVLAATGTVNPALHGRVDDPEQRLKGGRLLGPMERLLILGLGLAGQWTAASIVVAAKGLLRWPELRSEDGQRHIHRLTEYFLVGSFVSWSVSFVALLLLHLAGR